METEIFSYEPDTIVATDVPVCINSDRVSKDKDVEYHFSEDIGYKWIGPYRPAPLTVVGTPEVESTLSRGIVENISNQLLDVPEVRLVCGTREGNVLCVFTVIDELDEVVEDRIYDIQGEIIDQFMELEIDFNLAVRCGRDLDKMLNSRHFDFRHERPSSR